MELFPIDLPIARSHVPGSYSDIGGRLPGRSTIASVEVLHENAMKIALDVLARSGGLTGSDDAVEFVGRHIARQIDAGERRTLKLSNLAIDSYRRYRDQATLPAAT